MTGLATQAQGAGRGWGGGGGGGVLLLDCLHSALLMI